MGICSSSKPESLKTNVTEPNPTKQPKETPPKLINLISTLSIQDDIFKHYKALDHIGSGSFGMVREFIDLASNKHVAVKSIWKSQFSSEQLLYIKDEIETLLTHENQQNIIKCHSVFEDKNCIHFVFDLVHGGDLFDFIFPDPKLPHKLDEWKAAFVIDKVLRSIAALHEQNIVHRDIKPENYLIEVKDNDVIIKLIDFGFAKRVSLTERMRDIVGSPSYMSPQVYEGNYNRKCDVWAAGIILYSMLVGFMPFRGKTPEELRDKVIEGEASFDKTKWSKVSKEGVELVKLMLEKDEQMRPNADELLKHPLLVKEMV